MYQIIEEAGNKGRFDFFPKLDLRQVAQDV